jgi:ceramide glucosyltransferase
MIALFTTLASAFVVLQMVTLVIPGLLMSYRVVRHRAGPVAPYRPKAVVIVPCKGVEPRIEENIRALMNQDYPDYSLVFVTESESDAAYALISRLITKSGRPVRLVVAGMAEACGQKVHNLCAAIEAIGNDVEVVVFADSDVQPRPDWLAQILAPLASPDVGATTGYRWHIPVSGNFWSLLLASWNAQALAILSENSHFAWGGSMAMRRADFERLEIREHWRGGLSDDLALSNAVRRSGLRIAFVPQCLVASHADVSVKQLLEFTTRQIIITRIYLPEIWWQALFGHFYYSAIFWGGWMLVFASTVQGTFPSALACFLTAIIAQSACHAASGLAVAMQCLSDHRQHLARESWAYLFMEPLMTVLYLFNGVASCLTRRIVWRGVVYEMVSPKQTRILGSDRVDTCVDTSVPS